MPSIGPMEIVAVAAIALIVFGPEKLPEIARTVGRTLSQLRRMADDVRDEFKDGLDFNVDDEEDEDTSGPAPRRDHPNVRAGEAASAATPAWEQRPGEDNGPKEEFDPNYDVEAVGTTAGDPDDVAEASEGPAPERPAGEVGGETPSTPEAAPETDLPAAPTEGDRPPEQRAG